MKSSDLSQEVADIVIRLASRIQGPGDETYSEGDTQRFESGLIDEIFNDAIEEIEDLIVYSCQLHIRVEMLRKALLVKK